MSLSASLGPGGRVARWTVRRQLSSRLSGTLSLGQTCGSVPVVVNVLRNLRYSNLTKMDSATTGIMP